VLELRVNPAGRDGDTVQLSIVPEKLGVISVIGALITNEPGTPVNEKPLDPEPPALAPDPLDSVAPASEPPPPGGISKAALPHLLPPMRPKMAEIAGHAVHALFENKIEKIKTKFKSLFLEKIIYTPTRQGQQFIDFIFIHCRALYGAKKF
jgi:hypothetical protein